MEPGKELDDKIGPLMGWRHVGDEWQKKIDPDPNQGEDWTDWTVYRICRPSTTIPDAMLVFDEMRERVRDKNQYLVITSPIGSLGWNVQVNERWSRGVVAFVSGSEGNTLMEAICLLALQVLKPEAEKP